MLMDMPAAPNIMRLRLPNFSIVKMAIQDAIQYSVPLQAAKRRLRKSNILLKNRSSVVCDNVDLITVSQVGRVSMQSVLPLRSVGTSG